MLSFLSELFRQNPTQMYSLKLGFLPLIFLNSARFVRANSDERKQFALTALQLNFIQSWASRKICSPKRQQRFGGLPVTSVSTPQRGTAIWVLTSLGTIVQSFAVSSRTGQGPLSVARLSEKMTRRPPLLLIGEKKGLSSRFTRLTHKKVTVCQKRRHTFVQYMLLQ